MTMTSIKWGLDWHREAPKGIVVGEVHEESPRRIAYADGAVRLIGGTFWRLAAPSSLGVVEVEHIDYGGVDGAGRTLPTREEVARFLASEAAQ